MRILYYSAHPDLVSTAAAGYATHMRGVIEAFRTLGHEVRELIAGDREREAPARAPDRRPSPGRLRRVVPGPLWQAARDLAVRRHDRAMATRLAAAIREFRPDLVYERTAYLCRSGVRAAGEAGVPIVLEVNAPYREERRRLGGRNLLSFLGASWEREVIRGSTRVVVVSGALRDRLVEATGLEPDRFVVMPNGVDPRRFEPTEKTVDSRDSLGVPEDVFLTGFVGSFLPWTRLDRLIDALALLGEGHQALVVGDGPIRPDLERRAAEAGVADRITFTGSVSGERVPALIRLIDAGVVPGHEWYCSPIKLFEYGVLGRPVVAIDTAPVREVLTTGREGLLVGETAEDLADALARLRDDPDFARSCGEAFRSRILKSHTWSENARRVLASVGPPDGA